MSNGSGWLAVAGVVGVAVAGACVVKFRPQWLGIAPTPAPSTPPAKGTAPASPPSAPPPTQKTGQPPAPPAAPPKAKQAPAAKDSPDFSPGWKPPPGFPVPDVEDMKASGLDQPMIATGPGAKFKNQPPAKPVEPAPVQLPGESDSDFRKRNKEWVDRNIS